MFDCELTKREKGKHTLIWWTMEGEREFWESTLFWEGGALRLWKFFPFSTSWKPVGPHMWINWHKCTHARADRVTLLRCYCFQQILAPVIFYLAFAVRWPRLQRHSPISDDFSFVKPSHLRSKGPNEWVNQISELENILLFVAPTPQTAQMTSKNSESFADYSIIIIIKKNSKK